MNRIALAGVALIALVSLAALAQTRPATEAQPSEAASTQAEPAASTQPISRVSDPGLEFDLKLPDGWSPRKKLNPKDPAKLILAPDAAVAAPNQVTPQIRVSVQDSMRGAPFKEPSLTGLAERAASAVTANYVDGKLLTFDQLKIDGTAAYRITSTGQVATNKTRQTNTQYLTIHNGKFYGFYYSSAPELHEKFAGDVGKIIDSLKWKQGASSQPYARSAKTDTNHLPSDLDELAPAASHAPDRRNDLPPPETP